MECKHEWHIFEKYYSEENFGEDVDIIRFVCRKCGSFEDVKINIDLQD